MKKTKKKEERKRIEKIIRHHFEYDFIYVNKILYFFIYSLN